MPRYLALAVALVLFVVAPAAAAAAEPPLTILVSIDGFRPDYLDRGVTPNLSALAAKGVRAAMRPSFPSKTFPNHYTLVTGLRPDHHGVVENNMVDAAMADPAFTLAKAATADPRWWGEATPIWVSAERAGLHTATMFWPGSDAVIHGVRPSHWRLFDMTLAAPERTDQLLAWLDDPPRFRARLAMLYFDDVDTAGHKMGPDGPELNQAVARVDAAIGRLVAGLAARHIAANLVIVADHGMAATPVAQRIFYDDLFGADAARVISSGAYLSLVPAPSHASQVEQALLAPHDHMQCWRKAEIPARFHYGANPRVPPLFCLPDTGWSIVTHAAKPGGGNHGFDPYAPEMAAVFIGEGPAFRHGVALPTFDNVAVYPLLARLIGLTPLPNDGNLADIAPGLLH